MAQPITPADLKHLLDTQATCACIDVREAGEYNSTHIPGTSLVPRRELEFRMRRLVPPKELPREVRPFWRRVRSVLEGGAAVGEPRLTGGVGCRGVRGTDLPLSPCATLRGRVSEALREDEHGRRGHHDPCAARGTSVYPSALACLVMAVPLR